MVVLDQRERYEILLFLVRRKKGREGATSKIEHQILWFAIYVKLRMESFKRVGMKLQLPIMNGGPHGMSWLRGAKFTTIIV